LDSGGNDGRSFSDEEIFDPPDDPLTENHDDFFDDELDAQLYRMENSPETRDGTISFQPQAVALVDISKQLHTAVIATEADPDARTGTQTNMTILPANSSESRTVTPRTEAQPHMQTATTPLDAPCSASRPRQGFTYDGITCSCIAGDHERDASLSPASLLHIRNSCRILEALRLSFHKLHRYLICSCHGGSFVALGQLKDHMKKKHTAQLRGGNRKNARADYIGIVQHFATSFQIQQTQSAIAFDKETLAGPVAGLAPPTQTLVCPECGLHYTSTRTLVAHHRHCTQRPGQTLLDLQTVSVYWTQFPFAMMAPHSKRVQVEGPFEEGNTPDMLIRNGAVPALPLAIEPYIVPKGTGAHVPSWLKSLGWTIWRDNLVAMGISIPHLYELAALPKLQAGVPSIHLQLHRLALYAAKPHIHARLTLMLEDANLWLAQCNSELRTQFGTG
jgi:hypothetical protein